MNDRSAYIYPGDELDVFAKAVNWKRYYSRYVERFIRGDVLEVGAGIGGTTQILAAGQQKSWLCLEPDPALAKTIQERSQRGEFAANVEVLVGQINDLPSHRSFDSILYIDVLEHLSDDRGELRRARKLLKRGGSLVVLSPAHQFLYSEFDRAVGHCRRYNASMLRSISPPGLKLDTIFYLDSLGMLLSMGNKLLLGSGKPTDAQIQLWDQVVIPLSKYVDPMTNWRIGKSIIAVWTSRF
jgi:SAM-dependent methyltransferase